MNNKLLIRAELGCYSVFLVYKGIKVVTGQFYGHIMAGKSHSKKANNQQKSSNTPIQSVNNGGPVVNSQYGQGAWCDMNSAQGNATQQMSNMYQSQQSVQYQAPNHPTQSAYMQPVGTHNQNMNMNMSSAVQGQCQGRNGLQQNSDQYGHCVGYTNGNHQQSQPVNSNSDNGTLIHMIQQMNNNFMGRLNSIESSVSKLSSIESELSHMRSDLSKLQLENANISKRMSDVEKSCQGISNMFDDAKATNSELKRDITGLQRKIGENITKFEDRYSALNNDLQEIKARSMQSNLVFYGLGEAARGTNDHTEDKLKDFLKNELSLEKPEIINDMVFDRVHRLGRPRDNQDSNPRPIVAKFERYKDRELIRIAGKDLNEKRNGFSIREQFPPEIEAKRKLLYPVMRSYLKDSRNRVALVRDKLYINGKLYTAPVSNESEFSGERTETFDAVKPSQRKYARGVRLVERAPIETRNTFEPLASENDTDSYTSIKPGKRPASSPAHDENISKQYRGTENELIMEQDTSEIQNLDFCDNSGGAEGTTMSNCSHTDGNTVISDTVSVPVNEQTITAEIHSEASGGSCITDLTNNADIINASNCEGSQ
ncbi:MAG: hypothetical protein AB2693_26950 [Candidatus Thiodiazotropha sp.]